MIELRLFFPERNIVSPSENSDTTWVGSDLAHNLTL